MTDDRLERIAEVVEGHVAEHRQTNGPGAMAISDADRLCRANILAAIVDLLGITWHHAENARRVAHNPFAVDRHIMEETARILLTLWNASKGADDE